MTPGARPLRRKCGESPKEKKSGGWLLEPGTPADVGFTRKPPIFLKAGDVVVVEIENIGGLRNRVVDEAQDRMSHDIRKTALSVETVWRERGPRFEKPLLVGTAVAVIRNPFAGRYQPDLMPFQASLREVGRELPSGLIAQLGGAERIEAYGEGIIVARMANSSTAPCGARPAATACARCWANPRRSCRRRRPWVGPARA
jgi:Amino acid synthesis